MRISQLRKLVEQLVAGGSGGGVPDLTQETNIIDLAPLTGTGLDVDGLLVGPGNINLRDEVIAWNNDSGALDLDQAYFVIVAYVTAVDDDWGSFDLHDGAAQQRLQGLRGPATIDVPQSSSIVMPANKELHISLGTAGFRISNIQLYPLV